MHLWGFLWKVPWFYGITERNRSKSRKVRTILEMSSPKMIKEVQSLTRRLVALNRFVFKATDKCFPFFKTLKQAFVWTDECKATFQELKRYLSNPPLLSPSKEGEDLFLYLVVFTTAVSAALIKEENRIQCPVYYISQAFPVNREDHILPDSGL